MCLVAADTYDNDGSTTPSGALSSEGAFALASFESLRRDFARSRVYPESSFHLMQSLADLHPDDPIRVELIQDDPVLKIINSQVEEIEAEIANVAEAGIAAVLPAAAETSSAEDKVDPKALLEAELASVKKLQRNRLTVLEQEAFILVRERLWKEGHDEVRSDEQSGDKLRVQRAKRNRTSVDRSADTWDTFCCDFVTADDGTHLIPGPWRRRFIYPEIDSREDMVENLKEYHNTHNCRRYQISCPACGRSKTVRASRDDQALHRCGSNAVKGVRVEFKPVLKKCATTTRCGSDRVPCNRVFTTADGVAAREKMKQTNSDKGRALFSVSCPACKRTCITPRQKRYKCVRKSCNESFAHHEAHKAKPTGSTMPMVMVQCPKCSAVQVWEKRLRYRCRSHACPGIKNKVWYEFCHNSQNVLWNSEGGKPKPDEAPSCSAKPEKQQKDEQSSRTHRYPLRCRKPGSGPSMRANCVTVSSLLTMSCNDQKKRPHEGRHTGGVRGQARKKVRRINTRDAVSADPKSVEACCELPRGKPVCRSAASSSYVGEQNLCDYEKARQRRVAEINNLILNMPNNSMLTFTVHPTQGESEIMTLPRDMPLVDVRIAVAKRLNIPSPERYNFIIEDKPINLQSTQMLYESGLSDGKSSLHVSPRMRGGGKPGFKKLGNHRLETVPFGKKQRAQTQVTQQKEDNSYEDSESSAQVSEYDDSETENTDPVTSDDECTSSWIRNGYIPVGVREGNLLKVCSDFFGKHIYLLHRCSNTQVAPGGLAHELENEFPLLKRNCLQRTDFPSDGSALCFKVTQDITVCNIYAQDEEGGSSQSNISSHRAFERGLSDIERMLRQEARPAEFLGVVVFAERIGCGISNGNQEMYFAALMSFYRRISNMPFAAVIYRIEQPLMTASSQISPQGATHSSSALLVRYAPVSFAPLDYPSHCLYMLRCQHDQAGILIGCKEGKECGFGRRTPPGKPGEIKIVPMEWNVNTVVLHLSTASDGATRRASLNKLLQEFERCLPRATTFAQVTIAIPYRLGCQHVTDDWKPFLDSFHAMAVRTLQLGINCVLYCGTEHVSNISEKTQMQLGAAADSELRGCEFKENHPQAGLVGGLNLDEQNGETAGNSVEVCHQEQKTNEGAAQHTTLCSKEEEFWESAEGQRVLNAALRASLGESAMAVPVTNADTDVMMVESEEAYVDIVKKLPEVHAAAAMSLAQRHQGKVAASSSTALASRSQSCSSGAQDHVLGNSLSRKGKGKASIHKSSSLKEANEETGQDLGGNSNCPDIFDEYWDNEEVHNEIDAAILRHNNSLVRNQKPWQPVGVSPARSASVTSSALRCTFTCVKCMKDGIGIAEALYRCTLCGHTNFQKYAKRYFGHKTLRPLQEAALTACLQGRNVAVYAPTGSGKSLVYMLPARVAALEHNKLTIYIVPQVSLGRNQAIVARQYGIRTVCLSSQSKKAERDEAISLLQESGKVLRRQRPTPSAPSPLPHGLGP